MRLLAATVWLPGAVPVQASTDASVAAEAGVTTVPPTAPETTAGDDIAVRIRVGRAIDLEGAPVYSARSTFSGTATLTTFSSRPIPSTAPIPAAAIRTGMPLKAEIISGFGMRVDPILGTRRLHSGVDLAAPNGSPIVATSDGTVSRAGWNGGYGLYVALEHGGGLQTRYGHMSRLNVVEGQRVRTGEVIGFVGSTGRSTGPHLHFETRVGGRAVRPSFGRTRPEPADLANRATK